MKVVPLSAFLLLLVCGTAASDWSEKAKELGEDALMSTCFWCQKTIPYAKRAFRAAIDEYDDQQIKVGESFSGGKKLLFNFDTLLREAKDKDAVFKQVHDSWLSVEKEVNELNDQFENLVKSSDQLFSVLDGKADGITDNNLKLKSKKKITEHRARYRKRLGSTKSSVETLESSKVKVMDMVTSLEISYTLDTLGGRIETTLDEIDDSITTVMADLASLSVESKALLGNLE